MKTEERIERYGKAAYENHLAQKRAYYKAHKEQENARTKKYREKHPEQVISTHQEQDRKDGRYYDKKLEYNRTGLRGERNVIRNKHGRDYKPYKQIIAPESQIHHEWVLDTSEYRGVALVEAKPHQYGIIDVIQILDGKITLLTEEQVRKARREPEAL